MNGTIAAHAPRMSSKMPLVARRVQGPPAVNPAWHWTAGRGWFEVAPGAAAFAGGLLLLTSTNRAVTIAGSWLGIRRWRLAHRRTIARRRARHQHRHAGSHVEHQPAGP